MKIKSFLKYSFLLAALPFLRSCAGSGSGATNLSDGDTIELRHAVDLTLIDHANCIEARIRNPWDTTAVLATYILVPDTAETSATLPAGTVVKTPLKNALVYSAVHVGLAAELGALDAVRGVCDADYMNDPEVKRRIASGFIADCGNNLAPDIERIIALAPDAILLSPYEDSPVNARLNALGIPVIQCADYMERSPLARAEWMKFFGILLGKEEKADSMFAATEREYTAVRAIASAATTRPTIIFDGIYANQWFVPGQNSTLAYFISDAGGTNPFSSYTINGSIGLSGEEVLSIAHNADFWFTRYAASAPMTAADFTAQHRLYPRFRAVATGNIYGCNTIELPFYEEVPFHPQWFLADMASILHPELNITPPRRYFTRL